MHHVVDVYVGAQLVGAGQRVEGQTGDVLQVQAGVANPAAQLGRADELGKFVGSARQHAQDVLGANDGEHERLGIAVDGGEKHLAARLDQFGAGANHRAWIWHVLEHLQAGHHVKGAGVQLGKLLGGALLVVDADAGLQLVQAGDGQWRLAHVDAGHLGAALGHGLSQNAATAANVQHLLAGQAGAFVDPVGTQRVDLVQRFELAVTVPPAACQRLEFGDFSAINVKTHGVPLGQ